MENIHMSKLFRRATVVAILGVMTLGLAAPAFAHEERTVGKLKFTVGWGFEPTYAGFENSVQLILADAKGKPITDLGDALKLEVIFGSQTVTLPLETTFDPDTGEGTPGDYRAWFIPTRPGNYTFQFTGTYKGQKIDQKFTSSDTTFDPVKDQAAVQFPAKDPSNGDLSARIIGDESRTAAIKSTADKGKSTAGTALIISIVGLALGAIGLGTAALRGRSAKQA
jgi:hypothetical protein